MIYILYSHGFSIWNRRPKSFEVDNTSIQADIDPVQESIQTDDEKKAIIRKFNGKIVLFEPQATYLLAGRVLHAARYYFDRNAFLAPVDLAIGWGNLATHKYDSIMSYSQWGRSYHFQDSDPSLISLEYIFTHSSNNHLIPSNSVIDRVLKSIQADEIIEITGFLVNVTSENLLWDSSLTRTDTGDGACEVIYVQKVRIGNKVWR